MGALAGNISPAQRYQYALNAGFNASQAVVMAAISMLECPNCDMSSVNKTGDSSLWQINAAHGYSVDWLADPQHSADAAFAVFKSQGFGAWCTYPGGCGGASKTSWATFDGLINQVTQSIQQAAASGSGITMPDPSTLPTAGGDTGGANATTQTGAGTATTGTGSGSGMTQVGTIAGFPVNIPSGMIVGLIAVVLLLFGIILIAMQFKLGGGGGGGGGNQGGGGSGPNLGPLGGLGTLVEDAPEAAVAAV